MNDELIVVNSKSAVMMTANEKFCNIFLYFYGKYGLTFQLIQKPEDNSHEITSLIWFLNQE